MDFIKNTLPSITMFICSVALYLRVANVETNVEQRIENTINRLMPKSDTSRVIVAPELQSIGKYYYFDGKVIGKSVKFINQFEYDVRWPREIWDGYITVVRGKNGGNFYMWSENPITQNIEISLWVIADPHKFEIGYVGGKKDVYGQVLYPIVPIRKQTTLN